MGRKDFKADRPRLSTSDGCGESVSTQSRCCRTSADEGAGRQSEYRQICSAPRGASLSHIHPLFNLIICARQTPTTNRRGGRVVCTGAYAKQFQHQCLKLSDFSMADSDVGLLLHLKTTKTCCYNNISISELKLTLRVTSRPELE